MDAAARERQLQAALESWTIRVNSLQTRLADAIDMRESIIGWLEDFHDEHGCTFSTDEATE